MPLLLYLSFILFLYSLSTSGFSSLFETKYVHFNFQRRYFKLLGAQELIPRESIPLAYVAFAGILEQSVAARNRVGIGLSYRAR
jgi:hypothetical protein